jgi:hypothetical protein
LIDIEKQELLRKLCGFQVGQKVYWNKLSIDKEVCEKCKGIKTIFATVEGKPTEVVCPFCKGEGKVNLSTSYVVQPDYIRSIYIQALSSPSGYVGEGIEPSIRISPIFYLMTKWNETSADEIYETEEECREAVKSQ